MHNVFRVVFVVVIFTQSYTAVVVQENQRAANEEQLGEHCNAAKKTTQQTHQMYGSKQNKRREEKNEGQSADDIADEVYFEGIDEHFNPAILEKIIPTAKLNRKKLKMLGATGHYIRDFSGSVYEYVINEQWEGVWVQLSHVRIRVYGEIGEGRWRFAFNGLVLDSESELFPEGMKIVVKSVNDDVLKEQKEEEAVKRALQAQTLARKIAYIASKKANPGFGKFPEIIKVWMFRNKDNTWMVEEKLTGFFKKLINNDMRYVEVPPDRLEDQDKAAALAHFSLEFTEGEVLITDLQGVGLRWTDIEIATKTINDERFYGIGNLGRKPHNRFLDEHQCTKFCKFLQLPTLTPRCSRNVEQKTNDGPPKQPLEEDSESSGYNAPRVTPNNSDPLVKT